ncbi:unnamed protein product [Hyaloperonospora brassicae]|uniref:BTB domain-containing protein n=1 Tax=Hyaloperonospora brassicae TaxID=162125 RepID=A0AAV0V597_HYABA|nr:unnamed protein product [Hyaloperonospora brassicae]
MYRVADGAQRVLLLDAPAATCRSNANTDTVTHHLSTCDRSLVSCPVDQRPGTNSRFMLPSESEPPDVVIHSDGCAIALHLSVLRHRCPWVYKQLRQLRQSPPAANGFQLLDDAELERSRDNTKGRFKCPLRDIRSLRLDYVRCVAHACRHGHDVDGSSPRGQSCQQDSVVVGSPRRKRLRQTDANSSLSGQCVGMTPRRARTLYGELNHVPRVGREEEMEYLRGAMHVKIDETNIDAVVTAVEYIYRRHVRMIDERNALEAVKLGKKLGLESTMLYHSLAIAIRRVTTATWIELLLMVSTLENRIERRILCDHLMAFLASLKPEQYYRALIDMRCVCIRELKDHDVLLHAVVGLINNVRLVEFWRNLLNALTYWLSHRFCTADVPSLRAVHRHFAPEWEPYMERGPVDLHVKPGAKNLFSLLQFGKYQLQLRIDVMSKMPISWRIIRSSSPQVLSSDPDKVDHLPSFDDDPKFWIRGQVKVKYWHAQSNHSKSVQDMTLQYQHCYEQYNQWRDIVSPSPSTLTSTYTAAACQSKCMGKMQVRGKFFVWGDPVCSVYHFLLQSTLFYSAPHGSPTEIADLFIVSEMQRLPLETLELVLRSDSLRIPGGEQTLLRCLNKLFFGSNFTHVGSSGNEARVTYNCCPEDMMRLYECVRWCFVPVGDIIGTLRQSPRELMLYELIEKGLQDTFRCFVRRCPWEWRKDQHTYTKRTTSLVEFRIKASENQLSPEYFPIALNANSQESSHFHPEAICCGSNRVQSVP